MKASKNVNITVSITVFVHDLSFLMLCLEGSFLFKCLARCVVLFTGWHSLEEIQYGDAMKKDNYIGDWLIQLYNAYSLYQSGFIEVLESCGIDNANFKDLENFERFFKMVMAKLDFCLVKF